MKFRLLMSGLLVAGLMSSPAAAQLGSFFSDFQDLVPGPEFTPIGDGWNFFHTNVAGFPGTSYFGDAPQGPQISDLGDDGFGNQYLNVFSDYNNLEFNPALMNYVYQERSFTAADALLGQTWNLSFDYAGATSPFGVGDVGDAETAAYIRVLDGVFNLLAEETFDTTGALEGLWQQGQVSLTFDPSWNDGGIVQFGFTSNRDGTVFPPESTGVFYDNVGFQVASVVPEPSSLLLGALAGVGTLVRRRRST